MPASLVRLENGFGTHKPTLATDEQSSCVALTAMLESTFSKIQHIDLIYSTLDNKPKISTK